MTINMTGSGGQNVSNPHCLFSLQKILKALLEESAILNLPIQTSACGRYQLLVFCNQELYKNVFFLNIKLSTDTCLLERETCQENIIHLKCYQLMFINYKHRWLLLSTGTRRSTAYQTKIANSQTNKGGNK